MPWPAHEDPTSLVRVQPPFRYLNKQAREHRDSGQPVISVDTKKMELVGEFKTAAGSGGLRRHCR